MLSLSEDKLPSSTSKGFDMVNHRIALCALCLLLATALWAVPIEPAQNLPVPSDPTGLEPDGGTDPGREDTFIPDGRLDTPVGNVYQAGLTWYDYQHNGTAGKMIFADDAGLVHVVWMKGMSGSTTGARHIYYNIWDPATNAMRFLSGATPTGITVDVASRAGYACLTGLPQGWVFPAFHEYHPLIGPPGSIHSAAAIDYIAGVGAFLTSAPAVFTVDDGTAAAVWPKIAVGADSVVHMVSTESPPTGAHSWQRIYYSRGLPMWDIDGTAIEVQWQPVTPDNAEYQLIDTVATISVDVAASKNSSRVAIAYAKSRHNLVSDFVQLDNDIAIMLSEDGGQTWGPITNITNFANADTFRAYTDVSLVFDQNDVLHVAFSTPNLFRDEYGQLVGNRFTSLIWHWDEVQRQFSTIADGWSEVYQIFEWGQLGAWQRVAQRPSLAVDPITGYLYCSYQHYDMTSYSTGGYANADAFIGVSTNGGLNWSIARNVTDTYTASPTPAGQCRSERDITLADRVTYSDGIGYLHLSYILDYDAGACIQTPAEGIVTNNPVNYQRIAINDIPQSPLQPNFPIHVGTPPPLVYGRCCYGPDVINPICTYVTSPSCAWLYGQWDSTLTCATPCPSVFECTCRERPNTICNDVGGAIPDGDGAGTDFVVHVGAQYLITALTVCLDITHQNDENLVITLQSPSGHSSLLASRQGAEGQNYTCTSFDDAAFDSIGGGYPPYRGTFAPMTPLSVFIGENAVGDWILHVTDVSSGNTGRLNWVCLNISYDEILPVELTTFAALGQADGIHLSFATASETNNARFEILRGLSQTGSFSRIVSLNSQGNSSAEQHYNYVDTDVAAGTTYWYYLADISLTGARTEHRTLMRSASMLNAPIPQEYSLRVYPNPFNPTATVEFSLTEAGPVKLTVYDVHGRVIQTLTERKYDAGKHHLNFEGMALPAGVYFARIEAGTFVKTQKMVLLK
jgi:subtilisin-like proprotein convertase family protein